MSKGRWGGEREWEAEQGWESKGRLNDTPHLNKKLKKLVKSREEREARPFFCHAFIGG